MASKAIEGEVVDPNIKKYKLDEAIQAAGTIFSGEYHPAADSAMRWFKNYVRTQPEDYARSKMAILMAAEDSPKNRLAVICRATIERLAAGAPVSDRYLLGLVWFLKELQENKELQP